MLRRLEPEALPRAAHEGLGPAGLRLAAPPAGASLGYDRRDVEIGPERLLHLHLPQHGPGEAQRFARAVVPGEHPVDVDRRQLDPGVGRVGPGPLERLFMVQLAHRLRRLPEPHGSHLTIDSPGSSQGPTPGASRGPSRSPCRGTAGGGRRRRCAAAAAARPPAPSAPRRGSR